MINNVDVREALRVHLVGLAPAIETDWENYEYTPTIGTPFQSVHFKPNTPVDISLAYDNATMGLGFFQVTLKYPKGTTYIDADTRANLLVSHFNRGTELTNDTVEVTIEQTPSVDILGIIDDRYQVAVTIYYIAKNIV